MSPGQGSSQVHRGINTGNYVEIFPKNQVTFVFLRVILIGPIELALILNLHDQPCLR